MNRWNTLLVTAAVALIAGNGWAQAIVREAPKDVKPGIIEVTTAPRIKVDGKDDRFTPGVRVRDEKNMLVLTGRLTNKKFYTVYRRDVTGQVHEVWLLTPEEYRRLGGEDTGNPQGYKRFAELLDIIWAARAAGWLR